VMSNDFLGILVERPEIKPPSISQAQGCHDDLALQTIGASLAGRDRQSGKVSGWLGENVYQKSIISIRDILG
jgi:hypothetical protein